MGRKRTLGLYQRKGIWHIDKQIDGSRLCENSGTSSLEEAKLFLARRIEQLRQARIYGVRPTRIFREAATRYLLMYQHKKSIADDAIRLRLLDPFIGNLLLEKVYMQTLEPFITGRRALCRKSKTINLALEVVLRILNLAATECRDENGLTWLEASPKIKLLPVRNSRPPYPLAWEEQDIFFNLLPEHLNQMAVFKVNNGNHEQEVCQLH